MYIFIICLGSADEELIPKNFCIILCLFAFVAGILN